MKKIIFLIPVFNDWESLSKLIVEVSKVIEKNTNFEFKFLIINDGSNKFAPKIKKPENIISIKIINMRENRGHTKCIAFGISYINDNEKFDNVILMDGDGEDRPEEILNLLEVITKNPKKSIVAKRVKRSEGFLFRLFYKIHKIFTFVFTGKMINFGNYTCIIKDDIETLASQNSLWRSYSGTFKKNLKSYNEINSIRGLRYFGPSKMSFFKLLIHSFSIIAVFKYHVLLRSFIFIAILIYMSSYLGIISNFLQILIILFNVIIYFLSFNIKKEIEFLACEKNLNNIQEIAH